MDLQLKDKVVVVTGGSKGIGEGIAAAFRKEGAKVAIIARGEKGLKEVEKKIPGVFIYRSDLTDSQERRSVFQKIMDEFGTIDVLVNNAGGSNGSSIMETDLELFEEAMELNFLQAVDLSKMAAKEMRKKKKGAIINITSIFGRESGGKPTYNASKSALISFTKAMADELIKDGVRVNGVAPGSILHPTGNWKKRLDENPEKINKFVKSQIPGGRFGTVEEVANVVLFLASERASWIVGATLNVDGGQSRMNF